MLDEEVARAFQVVGRYPAECKLVLDRFLSRLRKRPAGTRGAYLDDVGCDTHPIEHRQQFVWSRDQCLFLPVDQAKELGRLIGRWHAKYVDDNTAPARPLQLLNERLDLRDEVRHVRCE